MLNKLTELMLKLAKQTSISQTDQNEGIILPNERKCEIVPNVKKPDVVAVPEKSHATSISEAIQSCSKQINVNNTTNSHYETRIDLLSTSKDSISTTIKTSCQEMNISSEDEDSSILDDSDNDPNYNPDECTKKKYAFLSLKKTTTLSNQENRDVHNVNSSSSSSSGSNIDQNDSFNIDFLEQEPEKQKKRKKKSCRQK